MCGFNSEEGFKDMVTATLNRVSGSAPQSLRWWAEEVLVTLGAKFGACVHYDAGLDKWGMDDRSSHQWWLHSVSLSVWFLRLVLGFVTGTSEYAM